MRHLSSAFIIILLSVSQSIFAANNKASPSKRFIPDSYIVTFKPSSDSFTSPIIPLSVGSNASRSSVPPFGEHGTGQSREELARVLGINGKVAKIFTSMNAAHLRVDATDAARLMRDPRVMRVEQDSIEHN